MQSSKQSIPPRRLLGGAPMRVRKEEEADLTKEDHVLQPILSNMRISNNNNNIMDPNSSCTPAPAGPVKSPAPLARNAQSAAKPSLPPPIPTWEEMQLQKQPMSTTKADARPSHPQQHQYEVLASTNYHPQATAPPPRSFTVQGVTYQVIKEVGKGGSSTVYCAMRMDDLELVALKHVMGKDNVSQLRDEIQLLLKLRQVPQVVRYIGHEIASQQGVLVMELGQTDVSQCFAELTRNPETGRRDLLANRNTVKFFFEGMVQAVQAIHAFRIVHGDLKPANFVFSRGKIKLIDFGIAKSVRDDTVNITRDGMAGTMNYIPPEALMENDMQQYKLSCKADVWSLGCILYSMCYGAPPFQDVQPNARKIMAILNPQHEIKFPATCGAEEIDLMRRCLQRDVDRRLGIDEVLAHPFLTGNGNADASSTSRKAKQAIYHLVVEISSRADEVWQTVMRHGGNGRGAAVVFAKDIMNSLAQSENIADAVDAVLLRRLPQQHQQQHGGGNLDKENFLRQM